MDLAGKYTKELDKIIESCHRTFNKTVRNGDFYELNHLLHKTKASELGIEKRILEMNKNLNRDHEVLFEASNFAIHLFMIPQGRQIPVHDHPLMTVLLKPLWGTLRMICWDWASEFPWSGLARQTMDLEMDGASPSILILPNTRNLHLLQAKSDCAFLDIFSPLYSEKNPCTYYHLQEKRLVNSETLYRFTI